jgi:hypothetical protein
VTTWSTRERPVERPPGVLAEDAEHDPLQAAVPLEMPADLLDLDVSGLLDRESAYPGAEGDQPEGADA